MSATAEIAPASQPAKSLAALAHAQAALRQQHRSRRQGAGARRAGDSRLRRGLRHHRRAAGHVRASCPTATPCIASSSGDAIATARPDILDRNGEVLATDVRVPSLYGEPRRLIDVDEAVELLTADLPDLDANELRERLSSKRGFVWLKRDITPEQQREIYRQGLPGIGFLNENKRAYPNGAEVSHLIGHVNIDNQGIAGMEKWLDGHGLAALHMAGLATDRLQTPVAARRRSARAARAARRTRRRAREIQGDRRRRHRPQRAHRRGRRHGVGAGLRPEQSAARRSIRRASTG